MGGITVARWVPRTCTKDLESGQGVSAPLAATSELSSTSRRRPLCRAQICGKKEDGGGAIEGFEDFQEGFFASLVGPKILDSVKTNLTGLDLDLSYCTRISIRCEIKGLGKGAVRDVCFDPLLETHLALRVQGKIVELCSTCFASIRIKTCLQITQPSPYSAKQVLTTLIQQQRSIRALGNSRTSNPKKFISRDMSLQQP